jgi:hypothetical protein
VQAKDIGNIINEIIAHNVSNHEEAKVIHWQETFRTPVDKNKKEASQDIFHLQHQTYGAKKEYWELV